MTLLATELTSGGFPVDASPEHFGEMRDSSAVAHERAALARRMDEDGYLLLRGALDRAQVLAARRFIVEGLAAQDLLEPGSAPMLAVPRQGARLYMKDDLADNNPPLDRLLYGGRMMEFFRHFLGGEVLHYDYTWLRTVCPGAGTSPHCDIVYMGRGTPNVFTAWTPLGDIGLLPGGLMVLHGSHHNLRLKSTYGRMDVDEYCVNRPNGKDAKGVGRGGMLGPDCGKIRKSIGGRWLTTEYRAGDLLVFSMFTVHAGLDNRSDRIRISTDSRYQLASEPADKRWSGPDRTGFTTASKKGRVC